MTRPRRLALAAVLSGLTALFLVAADRHREPGAPRTEPVPKTTPAEPAPDLSGFLDARGRVLDPTSLRGTVTVLNLLATWCAPCIEELPALSRLDAAGRANGHWRVVGLVADVRDRDDLAPFTERHKIDFPLYVLPGGGFERRLRVVGYPTTLILGADGRVLRRVMGPEEWDSPRWQATLSAWAAPVTAPTAQ